MLGRELARAAAGAGHHVLSPSHAELDVTDRGGMERAVADAAPHAVVNCAGWTDVDGAEERPEEALRVNGEGAGNVAAAAAAAGAATVYLSSDYVFDGQKGAPYVESDPVAPLSSYGRSKLAGERATAAANPHHLVVRSSWLFGPGGRNFVETMLRLASERHEVAVVHDQVGSPTYTGHLARGLLRLLEGGSFGLRHMAGAGACSWFDFAAEIFRRAGATARAVPCSTAEMPRPAKRPAYSALASERTDAVALPAWEEGLAAYLSEREVPA